MARTSRGFGSHELPDTSIARLAGERHGLFTRTQAVYAGLSKDQIQLRLSGKRWERLYEGVYRLSGAPATWRQSLFAACLAAAGVASHPAAALLWRLAGFEAASIEISVPRGRRPRPRAVIVHQLALPRVDVTVVDAIPVTTPARTLLDIAAVSPRHAVEEAVDDALRRGLVTLSRLRWRLSELGPRRGARTIRRLIDSRTDAAARPQSVLETRFLRLLVHAGLPHPESQHQIREGGRLIAIVDFAYPDVRLAIEVDGYRWHSGRISWQHDLERRNAPTRLGWRVIHVTAQDLGQRPEATVETIAEALMPKRRPR